MPPSSSLAWSLIQAAVADILENNHGEVVNVSTKVVLSNVTMQRENFADSAGRRFSDPSGNLILATSECIAD